MQPRPRAKHTSFLHFSKAQPHWYHQGIQRKEYTVSVPGFPLDRDKCRSSVPELGHFPYQASAPSAYSHGVSVQRTRTSFWRNYVYEGFVNNQNTGGPLTFGHYVRQPSIISAGIRVLRIVLHP
jgi:hypothetical protein